MDDKNQSASSSNDQLDSEVITSDSKNFKYNLYYYIFIFSALLSLGCIIGILFYADSLLSKTLRQIQASSYLENLVFKIDSGIVALNSDSRNFILTNDTRYFENYQKRGEVVIKDLKLILNDSDAKRIRNTAIIVNEGLEKHFKQINEISTIQNLLNSELDESLINMVKNNQKQLLA